MYVFEMWSTAYWDSAARPTSTASGSLTRLCGGRPC